MLIEAFKEALQMRRKSKMLDKTIDKLMDLQDSHICQPPFSNCPECEKVYRKEMKLKQ